MDVLTGWWDDYFWGALVVAKVFICSLGLMVLFGLLGAMAKLSKNRVAHKVAGAYTVVFRGTPEILVILLLYFGSSVILTAIAQVFNPNIKFVDVPPFWAGTIAISIIVGSYATETFRGAFLGVNPGSIEAARALGMSDLQTFVYIRIPEMWRLGNVEIPRTKIEAATILGFAATKVTVTTANTKYKIHINLHSVSVILIKPCVVRKNFTTHG